jgi:hypothetical protein
MDGGSCASACVEQLSMASASQTALRVYLIFSSSDWQAILKLISRKLIGLHSVSYGYHVY